MKIQAEDYFCFQKGASRARMTMKLQSGCSVLSIIPIDQHVWGGIIKMVRYRHSNRGKDDPRQEIIEKQHPKNQILNDFKMNGYDENRRRFLTKLGLSLGVTLTGTQVMQGENAPSAEMITINADQKAFMENYERWMDDFIVVIKFQKLEPHNLDNNMKIVALSEEAKLFQQELVGYMRDENFARYYMVATERMTLTI
jgi:hypothetical protein